MVSQSSFFGANHASFSSPFNPQLKPQVSFSKANPFAGSSMMGSQFPFLSALSNANTPSISILAPLPTKDVTVDTLKISKSNESNTPPKFPLFRKLPPEIRLAIWKEALPEKRSISLNETFGGSPGPITLDRSSQFTPPGLFHVNQESRSLILEYYGIIFGMANKPSYISTRRDEIRIDNETVLCGNELSNWFSRLDKEVPGGLEAIEHFVGRNFHLTKPIVRLLLDATKKEQGGLMQFLMLTNLKKLTITLSKFSPFTGELSEETVRRVKHVFEGYYEIVSKVSDGQLEIPVVEILSDAVFRMGGLPSALGHNEPEEKDEDVDSGDDTEEEGSDDEEDDEDDEDDPEEPDAHELALRWLTGAWSDDEDTDDEDEDEDEDE